MKKYKFILILLVLNCLLINNVKAYQCVYETTVAPNTSFSSGEDIELTLNIDVDKKSIEAQKIVGIEIASTTMDSYISSEWTAEKLIDKMDGGCYSKIYLCRLEQITNPGSSKFVVNSAIINPDLYNHLNNLTTSAGYRVINMNNIIYGFKEEDDCSIADLNREKSSKKVIESNFDCDAYVKLWRDLDENYCNINDDGNSCSTGKISKYNDAKDRIKKYCSNKLKYADYIDPCANSCIGLSKQIAELE